MVFDALRYQLAASRTDSTTSASGLAAASSGQNAAPGQSTTAAYPGHMVDQSTGAPSMAAVHRGISPGSPNISYMWWQGRPSRRSSASFSELVPVRATPAPTTVSPITRPSAHRLADTWNSHRHLCCDAVAPLADGRTPGGQPSTGTGDRSGDTLSSGRGARVVGESAPDAVADAVARSPARRVSIGRAIERNPSLSWGFSGGPCGT